MKQHHDRQRYGGGTDAEDETASAPSTALTAEETLLQLMFADERVIQQVSEQLDRLWLAGTTAGELIRQVVDRFIAGTWSGVSTLLNEGGEEEASRLVSRLLLEKLPPDNKQATAVGDCLVSLQRRWIEREWQQLQRHLRQPGIPPEQITALQQRVLDLRRKLDHISRLSVRQNATGQ